MQMHSCPANDDSSEAGAPQTFSSALVQPAHFDQAWYLLMYPDVARDGVDPYEHYVSRGKAEGRHPTQSAAEEALGFDRAWYLATYPDVAATEQDPFRHWIDFGRLEGRHLNAEFSFSPGQLAVLSKRYHCGGESGDARTSPGLAQPGSESFGAAAPFDSAEYWRDRYRAGGNSGAGSYGRLAAFKAEILNAFVLEHGVQSVIEFGCGDGSQLARSDYPSYLGFDVAEQSVELCRAKFAHDSTKVFRNAAAWDYERAELTLSLDVVYHLIEDNVFHEYMRRLFLSAQRFVIVYSSNHEGGHIAAHVKHRKFTEWVEVYHADFKLIRHIPNRWPLVDDSQTQSFADFYVFEKQSIQKHALPGHLVVSVTSYPRRFPTLELTLRRILQQKIQPDETILWVSPEGLRQLPQGVMALQRSGLTIRETTDIGCYTKIIPALELYPNSFIVTLDDDTAYPLDIVELFVSSYRSNREILCRRAHTVTFDERGMPRPYVQWQFETSREFGPNLFPTGVGGVFYPPGCLAPEVLDHRSFLQLAPYNDDLWLFWMGHRAGSTVRRVEPRYLLQTWPGCNEQGLFVNRNAGGGNDPVIRSLYARYGSPFSSESAEKIQASDDDHEAHIAHAPRPKFALLRRLARPFTKAIIRAFSNRFLPRAEATKSFNGLAGRVDEMSIAIQQTTTELAPIRHEAQDLIAQVNTLRESLAIVERSLSQFRQEEHDEFAQIRQEEHAQFVQVRLEEAELKAAISGFGTRVRELEKAAAFDRQAIHDLGQKLLVARQREPFVAVPGVGVVVATCDRPVQLAAALESLTLQSRRPTVVVVVNDGHDSVGEVTQRFAGLLEILELRTPTPQSGSSVARNVALDALQTPLVAYLDDDNLMWPTWLERASALFEDDQALDVIYGAQLRDSEFSATDKGWFLVPFDLDRLKKANFIDLNQLMHRRSDVRFDSRMRRLVDWDYVLKLIDRSLGRITPVEAISSIYSAESFARISVPNWPPKLTEITANRREGRISLLPSGQHECVCGYAGDFRPGPNGRPAASCPRCGSLERHRFLQLLAPLLRAFWIPSSRQLSETSMIEIAPSDATKSIRELFGSAVTLDSDPKADGRSVDVVASLTDLPLRSQTFDMVLALHVLEHIPDDRAAMREIARILQPNGVAVVQVPMSDAETTDEEVLDSTEDREARYGQADHVRMYGRDFYLRLGAAGLTTAAVSPRRTMPMEAIEHYALLPDEPLILAVRSDSQWASKRLEVLAAMLCKGAF